MPVAESGAKTAGIPARPVPFKYWFCGQIFDLLRAHGRFVFGWTVGGYCAYEVSIAIRSFAGQTTITNVTMQILANVSVNIALVLSVSGFSIALYMRERKQHRQTRKRMSARITELELRIDPKRTSSNLTPEGLTRKEDV